MIVHNKPESWSKETFTTSILLLTMNSYQMNCQWVNELMITSSNLSTTNVYRSCLWIFFTILSHIASICLTDSGLVVRISGYKSRDHRFDSRHYQIFWEVVGLEGGSLSNVSLTEHLHELKISGFGSRIPRLKAVWILCADHVTPSILKSWHYLRRQAAVAWSE
jgi:hypothetical protein